MDKVDLALREIADLRVQAREDFQFITLGMKDLATAMREMASRMDQMENRMTRQEERFDRMLLAVQAAVEGARAARPSMEDFSKLEARVDALETPPAA